MTENRTNKIILKCGDIVSISYIPNSLAITDGQPSNPPPSIDQNGDEWTISLDCGRSLSSEVAEQFTSICGGSGRVYTKSGGSVPDELNFYFGITMGINTSQTSPNISNLFLGQGHYLTSNNWWIGSNCMYRVQGWLSPAMPIVAGGTTIQVYQFNQSANDKFEFVKWFN